MTDQSSSSSPPSFIFLLLLVPFYVQQFFKWRPGSCNTFTTALLDVFMAVASLLMFDVWTTLISLVDELFLLFVPALRSQEGFCVFFFPTIHCTEAAFSEILHISLRSLDERLLVPRQTQRSKRLRGSAQPIMHHSNKRSHLSEIITNIQTFIILYEKKKNKAL